MEETKIRNASLEEIKASVSAFRPGTYHWVSWKPKGPLALPFGLIQPIRQSLVRFGINYNNIFTVRLENAIYKTKDEEDLRVCINAYDILSERQKSCVSPASRKILEHKIEASKTSSTFHSIEKAKYALDRDEEYPFILYAHNGSVVLQCFRSMSDYYKKPEEYSVGGKDVKYAVYLTTKRWVYCSPQTLHGVIDRAGLSAEMRDDAVKYTRATEDPFLFGSPVFNVGVRKIIGFDMYLPHVPHGTSADIPKKMIETIKGGGPID